MSDRWLTPTQVAADLGVSTNTVYRAIDSGRLTAYRFAKRGLSISVAGLETFKESSRVKRGWRRRVLVGGPRVPDLLETARQIALRGRR